MTQHSVSSVDPDGKLEYSVVFTDRSLNHMSAQFQQVMRDISRTLGEVYGSDTVTLVPGGGTFAMEAVARQFATDRRCLIIRNGWFSYRWSQILETGRMTDSTTVLKAAPVDDDRQPAFAPPPLQSVLDAIERERPEIVFAPHVETASGIILPSAYLRRVADAVHAVGGLFVLDGIASGAMWIDMDELGVDVYLSAPQKSWSASPCAGLVMLSAAATRQLENTVSTSFACDLRKWRAIMAAYEGGSHAYHATLPTDALKHFRDNMLETVRMGREATQNAQQQLGDRVRQLLAGCGFKSVAADGFAAPGVVVCYTDDSAIHSGKAFADHHVQIAAGVPLACDEPDSFQTFRLGLFGLDKLQDVDGTVARLEQTLKAVL